jgi:hypothetical protein
MGLKDDASTDIEKRTKSFADDMTEACAKLRKARMEAMDEGGKKGDKKDDKKKVEEPPVVTFVMEGTPSLNSARLFSKPNCWSYQRPGFVGARTWPTRRVMF